MGSPLAPFREALASAIASSQGLSVDSAADLERQIREPEPEHGDLAFPCFQLAKALRLPPPQLAQRLAETLPADVRFDRVHAVGPYLNVTLSARALADRVVPAARRQDYLRGTEGENRSVVVDFSSPNIAKPLGFHHIRSTVIGASVARLHAARGWRVIGINYLGDWGKQFGLLATGFARHGDQDRRTDAKHLVEVYVRANAEADVADRKARIARPDEVEQLAATLRQARATEVDEPKEAKKQAKLIKGLERKLRAIRGSKDADDPLNELPAFLAALRADAAEAAKELEAAEQKDREARQFLLKMERKDPEALAQWKLYREASIEDFQRVYDRLGIHFTALEGESRYQDVLEQTVEEVRRRPGTRIDSGAEVVDVDFDAGDPPAILKTRDGTTLYLTRDIAAAQDRYARFHFDRALYVVAADQSLHFRQLFGVLSAMGHEWADGCQHVAFGRIHGMSTRRGTIVFLDEVLDESVSKARAICEASDKIDKDHLEETIEAIGVGAVVFGDLKNLRTSDYTFDWEDVLQFNGHTGPYVQFSHARACSILRKGGGVPNRADLRHLVLDEERQVLRSLARMPDTVARACEQFEPSLVARGLIEVAQSTAAYLTAGNQDRDKRVLVDGPAGLRDARLMLMDAVRSVLREGLGLLGLAAPHQM
ncbi:MAG: arginine--tRNA ligase [Myxococcota bacterium]